LPSYTGDGGIVVGSNPFDPTPVQYHYNIDQSFTWQIQAPLEVDMDFLWNVGDLPLRWYVVEGMPILSNEVCDTFPCGPTSQPMCSIVYVSAQSLAQLCVRLREMRFNHRIKRIRVASIPAFAPLDPEDPCNTFEEVEDWRSVYDCLGYGVNGEGVQHMVMEAFGSVFPVYSYTGSGGIRLGGSGVVPTQSYVGSGGITLGGSADIVSSAFTVPVSGGITLGGSAEVACSHYSYIGSGGITLGGEAPVVSPSHHYTASGGIVLGGEAESGVVLEYAPVGNSTNPPDFRAITLGGSADAAITVYRYVGSGGITLGGEAGVACSHYSHTGSGGITLGGSAGIVSSAFSYVGSGGITLGGFVLPNYVGSGGITLGGEAGVRVIYSYVGSGGIILGGEGGASGEGYHYTGSGGITLGGEAEARTNFYDLEDEMVVNVVVEDFEAQFGTVAVENTLQAATASQGTSCVCLLPNQLFWSSNLPNTVVLGSFLDRNRLSMGTRASLIYNRRSQAWQHNVHLEGLGDRGINERWDIVYEWGCMGSLGTLSPSATAMWKLSVYVVRRAADRSYTETSRVLLTVTSSTMCARPDRFNFHCQVNTLTQEFRPVVNYDVDLDTQIISDEIGLFGGRWTNNPVLMLGVQTLPFPANGPTLNLTPMILANV